MPAGNFTCVSKRADMARYYERRGTPPPPGVFLSQGGTCGYVYTQEQSDSTDRYLARLKGESDANAARIADAEALAREQARDPARRERILESVRELARTRAEQLAAKNHDLVMIDGKPLWIVVVRQRTTCSNIGRGAWGGNEWTQKIERHAYALTPEGELVRLDAPDVASRRSSDTSSDIKNTPWANGRVGPSKSEMRFAGRVTDDEIAPLDRQHWTEDIIEQWRTTLSHADDPRLHIGWTGVGLTSTPKRPPTPPVQTTPEPKRRRWFGR